MILEIEIFFFLGGGQSLQGISWYNVSYVYTNCMLIRIKNEVLCLKTINSIDCNEDFLFPNTIK